MNPLGLAGLPPLPFPAVKILPGREGRDPLGDHVEVVQPAQGALKLLKVRWYAVRGVTRHPSDQESQRASVPKPDSESMKTTGGGLLQSPTEAANDRRMVLGQGRFHFVAELGRPRDMRTGDVSNDGLKEVAFQFRTGGRTQQFPTYLPLVPEASLEVLPEFSIDPSPGPEKDGNGDIAVANLPDQTRQSPEPLIRYVVVRVALGGRDEKSMGHAEFPQVPMEPMERFGIRRAPVRTGPESAFGPEARPRDLRPECRGFSRVGF